MTSCLRWLVAARRRLLRLRGAISNKRSKERRKKKKRKMLMTPKPLRCYAHHATLRKESAMNMMSPICRIDLGAEYALRQKQKRVGT